MSTEEQQIKLSLQVAGQDSIEKLRQSTANYKALLENLEASFAKGEVTAEEYRAAQSKLGNEYERQSVLLGKMETAQVAAASQTRISTADVYELADAYELVEQEEKKVTVQTNRMMDALMSVKTATADQNVFAGAVGRTGSAIDRTRKSSADMGFAVMNAGRAIQDFAQGGVGGVLNNIELLTTSMGGTAGLAGVLTAVGVAAYFAGPPLLAFARGVIDGSNPLPEMVDRLKGVEESLKKNADALGKLREKQSLTNTELTTYNKLLEEEAKLEAEKSARQEAAKVKGVVGAEQTARAGEFGAIVKDVGGPQVTADVKQMIQDASAAKLSAEALDAQATGLISNASRGVAAALDALKQLASEGRGRGTATAVALGGTPTPEQGRVADRNAADARDRALDRIKADAAFNAIEADRKLIEVLTKTGEENEEIARKQLAEMDAGKGKDAAAAAKQQEREIGTEAANAARNIGRSSVGANAQEYAARLRGSGMAPEAQQAMLIKAVRQAIQNVPGIPVNSTAAAVAGDAFKAVDSQIMQRQAEGLNGAQATQSVILQAQQNILMRLERAEANQNRLDQEAQRQAARSRTIQPRARGR